MKCAPLILRFMVIKESPLALCAVPPFTRGGLKDITLPPLLKGGGKASDLTEGFEIKRT